MAHLVHNTSLLGGQECWKSEEHDVLPKSEHKEPASEGNMAQSNAATPLHFLIIGPTKDIAMCNRLPMAHLVHNTSLLGGQECWKSEEHDVLPKSEDNSF
jgi:hypothetical protein